jgi:DNA-binding SARP family transcriptional activator
MPHLALTFFGPMQAILNGKRLRGFRSEETKALLAYLVLESDYPHARDALAALLWPHNHEVIALERLDQAVVDLSLMLEDNLNAVEPFLHLTRQTVQFNRLSNYSLDVADFLEHLASHQAEPAAELYRGELLTGLACTSEPFLEWLGATRAYFLSLALTQFFTLTVQSLALEDAGKARYYAERQLALEPWREEAHRQLMTALTLSGETEAALTHYQLCCRILAEQLGVGPDADTTALYEALKSGQVEDGAPAIHPLSPFVAEGLPAAKQPFETSERFLENVV